jgi:hypothetical protein
MHVALYVNNVSLLFEFIDQICYQFRSVFVQEGGRDMTTMRYPPPVAALRTLRDVVARRADHGPGRAAD